MSKIEEITDNMAEHFCNNLCWHPKRTDISQEQLEDICCECQMGKYMCDILNESERKRESAWTRKLMSRFMMAV